ncbi:MAG: hypothetical protein ACREQ5_05340 [Candidatus Dormibacteria bacterium]
MNIDLTYQSGQQYMETLSNFTVKVSRATHGAERLRISFKQKEGGHGYAAFSLPRRKARQLAYAILTACAAEDVQPVEFSIEESKPKAAVA